MSVSRLIGALQKSAPFPPSSPPCARFSVWFTHIPCSPARPRAASPPLSHRVTASKTSIHDATKLVFAHAAPCTETVGAVVQVMNDVSVCVMGRVCVCVLPVW